MLISDLTLSSNIVRAALGWVNVVEEGATGDGSTNDATAINNAITRCAAYVDGGTVFVPSRSTGSNYLIGTNITVPDNVTLLFSGGAKFTVATGVVVTINGSVHSLSKLPIFELLGTGSVTYGVAAQPDGSVNVKDYGATGDGVTDDTLAIQRAIDFLTVIDAITMSAHRGGTVWFPPGVYRITASLRVYGGGLRLLGPSFGMFEHGTTTPVTSHYGTATLLNDTANVTSGTTYPAVIQLLGSDTWITQRVMIEKLVIRNPETYHIGVQINSTTSTNPIDKVIVRDFVVMGGLYGLHIKGNNPIFGLHVENSMFMIDGQTDTKMVTGCYNESTNSPGISTVFRDTTFRNCNDYGAFFTGEPPGNVTFDNCTFESIGGPSVGWTGPTGQLYFKGGHWELIEQRATWDGDKLTSAVTGQRACLIWIKEGINQLNVEAPDAQVVWYGDDAPSAAKSMGLVGSSSAYNNKIGLNINGGIIVPFGAMGQPYVNLDRSGAVVCQYSVRDVELLDTTAPHGAVVAGSATTVAKGLTDVRGVSSEPHMRLINHGLEIIGDAGYFLQIDPDAVLNVAKVGLVDGVTAPGTASGRASIYVDTADGDLKIKFGDGVVRLLSPDVAGGFTEGATSVADGGTITHGLGITPVVALVTARVSGEFVSVTGRSSTTITVAIKKHDGTAGTTQIVDWRTSY